MGDDAGYGYPPSFPYQIAGVGNSTASTYAAQYTTDRGQQDTGNTGAQSIYTRQRMLRPQVSSVSSYGPSYSTATTSLLGQRSASYSGWSQSEWQTAQQNQPLSNAAYTNAPYPAAPYYSPGTSSNYALSPYYIPTTSASATEPRADRAATSLAIYTNGLPNQDHNFLSPHTAASPGDPTYTSRNRRGSQTSTSQSSEDADATESQSKHQRRHPCHWPQCSKAFRRKADLARHINCVHEKHTAKVYYCNARRCDRNAEGAGGGFTRKDHLIEHLRNFHHRNIPKRQKNRGVEMEPPTDNGAMGASSGQQGYYENVANRNYAYPAPSADVQDEEPQTQDYEVSPVRDYGEDQQY